MPTETIPNRAFSKLPYCMLDIFLTYEYKKCTYIVVCVYVELLVVLKYFHLALSFGRNHVLILKEKQYD